MILLCGHLRKKGHRDRLEIGTEESKKGVGVGGRGGDTCGDPKTNRADPGKGNHGEF